MIDSEHVIQLLKDANSLNSAGDSNAIAYPPRNLRQFRLGWLPASNWFRIKYGREAQITVISIDNDGSPVQCGLDPFDKSSCPILPCLTAMSPNGEIFAVANSNGKVDVRQAVTGEIYGNVLHCGHPHDSHKVIWMHFLDVSKLVAEYECGRIHNHHLEEHPSLNDRNIIHPLPPTQPSNILSTCSLDRSTIFRLIKLDNSSRNNKHDPDDVESKAHRDEIIAHPGDLLSAWILDCRSWGAPPRALPSVIISDESLLGPSSPAISHNNQYAAVVLLENAGSQHNACRRVHFWSIEDGMYLGFRDIRGPKWESWIPANHFDNDGGDHCILVPRNDAAYPDGLDLIVDVYHPSDVRLREGSSLQQMLPPNDWVFFVVHGGQAFSVFHSTSAIAFACSLTPGVEQQPSEFSHDVSMMNCEALALCIQGVVRGLRATCGGIPLDLLGTLEQASIVFANRGARAQTYAGAINTIATRDVDVTLAARDVALAARDVAVAARDVAVAARDVAVAVRAVAVAARDVAVVAHAAAIASSAAHAYATSAYADIDATANADAYRDTVHATYIAHTAIYIAHTAAYIAYTAADAADTIGDSTHGVIAWSPGIQSSGIFNGEEIFQIPQHLILPLLLHAHARPYFCHRSSAFRAVLGGYAHPFDHNKWVPVCILHFHFRLSDRKPDSPADWGQ